MFVNNDNNNNNGIFENIPQNGPEYSHRNLATAVRKNIGGLLS